MLVYLWNMIEFVHFNAGQTIDFIFIFLKFKLLNLIFFWKHYWNSFFTTTAFVQFKCC